MDGLTDKQATFVREYVSNGGNGAESARAAGYSTKSAPQAAWELTHNQRVLAAIQDEQRHALGRLASKALRVIENILDDKDAPAGVRLDAAKTALDRAGLAAQRPSGDVAVQDDGDLHEMPRAALMALLGDLQRQAAQVVLDCEPSEPQPDTRSV